MKVVFNHDPLRFCPTFDDLYLERPSLLVGRGIKEERRKKEKEGWSWKVESETWKEEKSTLKTEN